MKARLIVPMAALLCALSIAAEAGRTVGSIEVSEGPTPFIRFAHTRVSDVAGLLLFDDGAGSNFQQPPGETRTYSAPRKYHIDLGAFEATETWHYYPDPSVYSPFCSSVYEDAPDNYLIDYTLAGLFVYTGLVGLDALGNVAFNYQYDELAFVERLGTRFRSTGRT